jgi:hypothetical protein
MAKFVDYDPLRGVETLEDSYDGHIQLHYRQDVEPVLETAKTERINGLTDHGIKNDLWLYARIPPVIILEMRFKYGVDIFKRDHLKRAFEIINRDYPHLKCTEKRHTLAH